ncbi:hypothetical protein L9F63_019601, partial [Diploptera punctata]
ASLPIFILLTAVCSQQYNESPIQNFPHQQFFPSRAIKLTYNDARPLPPHQNAIQKHDTMQQSKSIITLNPNRPSLQIDLHNLISLNGTTQQDQNHSLVKNIQNSQTLTDINEETETNNKIRPTSTEHVPTTTTEIVFISEDQQPTEMHLHQDQVKLEEQAKFQEQARNAKYSFNSAISDDIMDNTQIREEVRNGLTVNGFYSYSDGFFKRTVHYEADENGFRVKKEEVEPIGSGPQLNLDGKATISSNIEGINNEYTITAADYSPLSINATV